MNKAMRLAVVLCVWAFFLTACDEKKPNEAAIRFSFWGSQTRIDATLKVLDLYKEKTGVIVEAEYMPFDSYFTKFNTLAAAGDLYDVFQLGGGAGQYDEQIADMRPFIDRGLIETADIDKPIMDANTYKGKLLGLSLGINAPVCLVYDPAIFRQAGVPEPADDWTWIDFENTVMTIHNKLGIFGMSAMADGQAGWGNQYYDTGNHRVYNDELTGLGYEDDQPIIDYLNMKLRITKAGAYPDAGRITEIKDVEGDFVVTGEAAMGWISSNQFVAMTRAAGRSLKLAFIPRRPGTPSVTKITSSQMLSIYSKSSLARQDEIAKFISFFVNDIDANLILNGERGIPAPAHIRDAVANNMDAAMQELYDFVDRVAASGDYDPPLPPEGNEIGEQYGVLYDQVIAGEISPEQMAADLRRFADEVFARSVAAAAATK
jgi:multiple sugar transport system substrate-binding protein